MSSKHEIVGVLNHSTPSSSSENLLNDMKETDGGKVDGKLDEDECGGTDKVNFNDSQVYINDGKDWRKHNNGYSSAGTE